jgi:predicted TIM-barrel fold metal-dependent hydrolase
MDFDFIGAGHPERDFRDQLLELSELRDEYPHTCLPFICADPRRPGVVDLIKEYIEERGYKGIKIYPPYGYFPYDPRLDPVYRYAESNGVPVLTHCAPATLHYRGRVTEEMRKDPLTGERLSFCTKRQLAELWVHPGNYRIVMEKFPDLKLCLAHFGGIPAWKSYLDASWDADDERCWFSIVLDLIREYRNLYTDVSYTVHEPWCFPLLKVMLQDPRIRTQVLYGSDYYMEEVGASERRYSINLRGYLGDADFRQIAEINPAVYVT